METFKRTVAANLIALRTANGMTQSELGMKLNYSDKSISKWERAESLPDAFVLKQISEIFSVSVDYLLTPHEDVDTPALPEEQSAHHYNKFIILLVALLGVYTLATLVFVVVWIFHRPLPILFLYAVPVASIVGIVLDSLWEKGKHNLFFISTLIWSVLLMLVFAPFTAGQKWWQWLLLGVPAQLIAVLCFRIGKKPLKNK